MMRRSLSIFQAASGGQLLIVYGSQTGTAENFARMMGPLAKRHNFTPVVCTMNDAVQRLGANSGAEAPKAVLCICSTYGVGEYPTNAQSFADALEAGQLPKLKGVEYSVLGLGNSLNDNFCVAAKGIDAGMKKAGAHPLVRTQLSCEITSGHDTSYRTWKRAVWAALAKATGQTESELAAPLVYSTPTVVGLTAPKRVMPRGFLTATVHGHAVLTPEAHEPEARLLTFAVPPQEQARKMAGRLVNMTDNVVFMPQNPASLVDRALARLGISQPQTIVEVTPLEGSAPSHIDHQKMSMRQVLSDVVDLSGIPSRSFLESLATTATAEADKVALDELANDLTAGGKYDTLVKDIFSVCDALEMFPSCKIGLDFLLSHAPHLQPRSYSISRDRSACVNETVEVLYTVPTKHSQDGAKTHVGVTTGMLQQLKPGQEVMVKFEPNPARSLPSVDSNVCIVALGSGIGPARALLQRRQMAKRASQASVGKAVLYYGFRHSGKDDLFGEELAEMEKEGVVEVHRVASDDKAGEFRTPLEAMDPSLGDFLAGSGEVFYCGMGGSVPQLVEAALRKNGVDTAAMFSSGRYHEEYFSADPDTENLLRLRDASAGAATLVGRVGSACDMFCMQCEQTFKGVGCTKVGVCGKTPEVAALQDLTVHLLKILSHHAHALRQAGVADNLEVNRLTLFALFATLTNVNFDAARFRVIIADVWKAIKDLEASYAKHGVAVAALPKGTVTLSSVASGNASDLPSDEALVMLGKKVGVLTRFTEEATQNQAAVAELLTYGLKGLAAYTDHSLMNGKENPEIYAYLHKALSFLLDPAQWADLGAGLGLALECGKMNVASMGMLYDSNKTLGVPSPHSVPIAPKPGKCLLVSGHDLIILEEVLKQCDAKGINVYTHGEMLPAHSYPTLRAHKSLAGHYGGAWMRQGVEFPHFPGAILMTTNCLTEPHRSYKDTIFTAGAVGWEGVTHVGNNMSDLDLAPVLEAAMEAPGFGAEDTKFSYPDPVGQKRPAAYTVGFGHETILGAAPTIIDQIKKGNITRFYLIGGCDGFEGQRSYYTDIVKNMPKTGVVLTLGCGKFRVNHLEAELGTIGDTGLPRVLDMGQCNDSFSAVQVALALAQVLECEVKDLPLSIVLSWFEQKAVAVLLSCLHLGLKPLHIGPSLPAFVTPAVLDVLVKDFGLIPTGDAKKDMEAMSAATGAS